MCDIISGEIEKYEIYEELLLKRDRLLREAVRRSDGKSNKPERKRLSGSVYEL